MSRPARLALATVADIPAEGLVVMVREGPFEEPAILVRHGTTVRAWKNRCRHLALRLDCREAGRLLDRHGNLVCQEHGATYRPDDGLCLSGPCVGTHLRALPVTVEDGTVYLDRDEQGAFLSPLPDQT